MILEHDFFVVGKPLLRLALFSLLKNVNNVVFLVGKKE